MTVGDQSGSDTPAFADGIAGAMGGGRDNGASGHGALNRSHVAHVSLKGLAVSANPVE